MKINLRKIIYRITSYNVCYTKLLRTADENISISFDLKNTGEMDAEEVVQVYVHRINPSVEWPYKELKAFTRVALKTGETQKVNLEIPVKNLRYWNEKTQAWENDLCDVTLMVGASSADIKLQKKISVITSYSIHYTKLYDIGIVFGST